MEKENELKNNAKAEPKSKNTDVAKKASTNKMSTAKVTNTKVTTAKATKNKAKSEKKLNTNESAVTQKKTTTKKSETTKKVVAKNVPVQKKAVTKKKEPVKKIVTEKETKQVNSKKESIKISTNKKEIKEQEELIAHVESVSEQAHVYQDLLKHNLLDENEEVSEELVDPKIFKDNELETIRKELKNNKKSNNSKSKKQEKYKEIFKNSLIFIFIELYFLILLISKSSISTIEYVTDLKVFILIELVVSIILFEISYKKENSKIAWHGIEMILLGATTILLLDLYSRQSGIINTVFAIIAGAFIFYYIIKMLVIILKKQK